MIEEGTLNQITYPSKFVEVYGSKMHYIEAGVGDPILFLHGIPTSSYIWRNIIPHLSNLGRCIAPDLIGFGWSDKPNITYSISDHIKYIEKFIEVLGLKKITLVLHGWGSIIGFDYAMRHEKNCVGLIFYEAFLRSASHEDTSLPLQEQMLELNQAEGALDVISNGSAFVDRIIPQDVMRELTEDEMNHYRYPFLKNGSGKPLSQYLKELPKGDDKGEVDKLISHYSAKLMHSQLHKLMLYSIPGFITSMATVMWAKANLPNIEIVDIGEELHLAQESCPALMGETMSVWLQGVEQS